MRVLLQASSPQAGPHFDAVGFGQKLHARRRFKILRAAVLTWALRNGRLDDVCHVLGLTRPQAEGLARQCQLRPKKERLPIERLVCAIQHGTVELRSGEVEIELAEDRMRQSLAEFSLRKSCANCASLAAADPEHEQG